MSQTQTQTLSYDMDPRMFHMFMNGVPQEKNYSKFFTDANADMDENTCDELNDCVDESEALPRLTGLSFEDVPVEVRTEFKNALKSTSSGQSKEYPARVRLFYWNDDFKPKKFKVPSAKVHDAASKTSETSTKKPQSTKTFATTLPKRKRVLAYVWVDSSCANQDRNERQGYVFYAGSVFNPLGGQNLELIVSDLLKGKKVMVPPYNRKGESATALGRLKTCPVIFKTNATSTKQVRKEIRKYMFSAGNKSERIKVQKSGNVKPLSESTNLNNVTLD
jgi:hypothetical protein